MSLNCSGSDTPLGKNRVSPQVLAVGSRPGTSGVKKPTVSGEGRPPGGMLSAPVQKARSWLRLQSSLPIRKENEQIVVICIIAGTPFLEKNSQSGTRQRLSSHMLVTSTPTSLVEASLITYNHVCCSLVCKVL